jgi:membrane-associated phospholipid phosphatase
MGQMEMIWQVGVAITLFFQALGSWLLLPMKAVSFLGQEEFFLMMLPAIFWCVDAGAGLRLGMMLVLTNGLNIWLKFAFQAPRPYWFDTRVIALANEPTFGMPSGHAQNAVALWGLTAWLMRKRWLWVVAGVVMLLTGLSRIYLGVHFADQVLLGWLVGAVLLWAFNRLEAPLARRLQGVPLGKLMLLVLLSSLVIILGSMLLALGARVLPADWAANAAMAAPGSEFTPFSFNDTFTIAGVWLGMGCGAAYQWRRFGPPFAGGPWQQRALRYALGMVGLLVIYLGLGALFPRTPDLVGFFLRYLRYALLGAWVSALAPAVFRRLRLV